MIVVVAGGTGGHFYPGLAVAKEIIKEGERVVFFIRHGDYVQPLLQRENIPFKTIHAGGLQRRLDPRNLLVPFKLVFGFLQAVQYLISERPRALLVMGGYLSVAPAVAARILGIPVVLHEQNVVPGLANKMLSVLASRVAVSFDASLSQFPEKGIVTGNPVRREFENLPDTADARRRFGLDPAKKTILVFGGSLGARRLNEMIAEALGALSASASSFQMLHVTGAKDFEATKARYAALPFKSAVLDYCHDMPGAYAASDLVIARSGASTVSELMVVKKPAVLVPYPYSTNAHQDANADVLVRLGTAEVYTEESLKKDGMKPVLKSFLENPARIEQLKANYSRLTVDPTRAASLISKLLGEVSA